MSIHYKCVHGTVYNFNNDGTIVVKDETSGRRLRWGYAKNHKMLVPICIDCFIELCKDSGLVQRIPEREVTERDSNVKARR